MNKTTLKAEPREYTGRKVKKLRKLGKVPANIYGHGFKSHSIQLDQKSFENVFSKVGETGLVEIEVGNDKKPVLVHNVQKDPVTDLLLHVDFLQVDLKQKVSAMVPVELIGESPAEKQSIGTVVQYINEIEVEALPEDLPDKFEIDLAILENVDQSIHIKDIKVDKTKVEITKDPEETIVKVEPPKEEKVEEPVVAETEGENVEGAGETPADGEGAPEGNSEKS